MLLTRRRLVVVRMVLVVVVDRLQHIKNDFGFPRCWSWLLVFLALRWLLIYRTTPQKTFCLCFGLWKLRKPYYYLSLAN